MTQCMKLKQDIKNTNLFENDKELGILDLCEISNQSTLF